MWKLYKCCISVDVKISALIKILDCDQDKTFLV